MKKPRLLEFKYVSFNHLDQTLSIRMTDKDGRPNILTVTIGEWQLIERQVTQLIGPE